MAQENVPPAPYATPTKPSEAAWLLLMVTQYLRFGYPERAMFTDEALEAALDVGWALYLNAVADENEAGKSLENS